MSIYEMVTDRILEELEKGTVPWRRPWSIVGGAYNRISGKPYSLLNQLLLQHYGEYATFNQWSKLGGKIRKGEHSECIVFWKWPEKEEEKTAESDDSEPKERQKPILKYYRVFHISQVDGIEPLPTTQKTFETEPIESAKALFESYVSREHIHVEQDFSNRAFYSPVSDGIHLPKIEQYENAEEYYSTCFHEAVHSTGHRNRLNRAGIQTVRYGSETYSKEELIAEIGSAFLLQHLGISTEKSFRNSSAYIDGWLKALRSDKRLIVTASGQAEKATKYILQ